MTTFTRLALRLVVAWRPKADPLAAFVERFIRQLQTRMATLSDPVDREALIAVAEREYESLLRLPAGTIRRRLTPSTE